MEKVACGFSKTAHKEVFVSLTMNLDDIGPYCTGLGILRSAIADGVAMPSVRHDLSHGAVGEMADVYSCTHSILNCLFPDKSADDWKDVVKKITTQIKRLKSKKNAKPGEYLVQKVTLTVSTDGVEAEGEGENMADNSVQCNLLGKQNAALQKEVQRLRAENVKLKEKLDSECSEDVLSGKVDELLNSTEPRRLEGLGWPLPGRLEALVMVKHPERWRTLLDKLKLYTTYFYDILASN